jgi:hypothetical protein
LAAWIESCETFIHAPFFDVAFDEGLALGVDDGGLVVIVDDDGMAGASTGAGPVGTRSDMGVGLVARFPLKNMNSAGTTGVASRCVD